MFAFTLKDVREKVVEMSGRYDLVVDTTDYEDNGADFYIRAGQKVLDTLLDTPQSSEERVLPVSSGDYKLELTEVRAIKNIWAVNDDGISKLEKKTMTWIRDQYGYGQQLEDVDTGKPLYYTTYRPQNSHPLAFKHYILFMPPSDGNYDLKVEGMFYSDYLKENNDTNYWTIEWPMTLVQAAMYVMERMYRNTEGANDHWAAIQRDLQGIDFDVAAQDSAEATQMKNSF